MFIYSMSRISIISVFKRCFTISRQIASRSLLSAIPMRCNESSVIRSKALPDISCYYEMKWIFNLFKEILWLFENVSYIPWEIFLHIVDIRHNVVYTIFVHLIPSTDSPVLDELLSSIRRRGRERENFFKYTWIWKKPQQQNCSIFWISFMKEIFVSGKIMLNFPQYNFELYFRNS